MCKCGTKIKSRHWQLKLEACKYLGVHLWHYKTKHNIFKGWSKIIKMFTSIQQSISVSGRESILDFLIWPFKTKIKSQVLKGNKSCLTISRLAKQRLQIVLKNLWIKEKIDQIQILFIVLISNNISICMCTLPFIISRQIYNLLVFF